MTAAAPGPVERAALAAHVADVAVLLVGMLLVRDVDGTEVVARIVETEAYRQDEPACHGHGRRTPRCEPMFWQPGTAYVYRSYGVHWCLNVVAEPEQTAAAVLVRAARVLSGHEAVRGRRGAGVADRELLRGPGNLARGLAIDDRQDRGDLVTGDRGLRLADDGWRPPRSAVQTGPRVGIREAADLPWRVWWHGAPEVSRYARSPRAPQRAGTAQFPELPRVSGG